MQLRSIVTPAKPATAEKIAYTGQLGGIVVDDGQVLKIETSYDGEEILRVGPPAGKRWVAYVKVDVQEFDA